MYSLLCYIQHMYSFFRQLHSVPTAFFSRSLTALSSLKWALHCNPGLAFTAHSWAPGWDSEDAIHCLTSTAFCNLGSNLHKSITLALYMLAKSALHKQWHLVLLPVELKLGPLRLQLQLPLRVPVWWNLGKLPSIVLLKQDAPDALFLLQISFY